MIVCSCNVLSDQQVKACMAPGAAGPRTPAQVYRCLGCTPRCGRCASTIRKIMNASFSEAAAAAVEGCTETCAAACLHQPQHQHRHQKVA